jgi:hypothetical protein
MAFPGSLVQAVVVIGEHDELARRSGDPAKPGGRQTQDVLAHASPVGVPRQVVSVCDDLIARVIDHQHFPSAHRQRLILQRLKHAAEIISSRIVPTDHNRNLEQNLIIGRPAKELRRLSFG